MISQNDVDALLREVEEFLRKSYDDAEMMKRYEVIKATMDSFDIRKYN